MVDDEPPLREVVAQYLKDDGFVVVEAGDGPTAIARFEQHQPDLLVLDINLPGYPGTEVLRRVRAQRDVPVLFLTARATEIDRVLGLELGADDYLGKPFSPRELVARVRSILRRSQRRGAALTDFASVVQRVGGLTINPLAHEVHLDGNPITLTPTQFSLLEVFAAHVGQTLTRDQLIRHLRADGDVFDRTLDRHIANLRARLEPEPNRPRYIVTVFGLGYKLVEPQ